MKRYQVSYRKNGEWIYTKPFKDEMPAKNLEHQLAEQGFVAQTRVVEKTRKDVINERKAS